MNVPPKLALILKTAALCGAVTLAGGVAAESNTAKKDGAQPQVKQASADVPTPRPIGPDYCPPCGRG